MPLLFCNRWFTLPDITLQSCDSMTKPSPSMERYRELVQLIGQLDYAYYTLA